MHNIPQRIKPSVEKLQRGHLLCKVNVVLVSDLSSAPKEAFETPKSSHIATVTPQAYEHQEMTLQDREHTKLAPVPESSESYSYTCTRGLKPRPPDTSLTFPTTTGTG